MFNIRCPWCGERPAIEFVYGGDASRPRPAAPETLSDEAWHDYVFIRDNPAGPHAEYWQHMGGCRQWLTALRDTTTHEFLATKAPGEPLDGEGQ
jgi:heterotetrameric sarcosine oxidase delta subunit